MSRRIIQIKTVYLYFSLISLKLNNNNNDTNELIVLTIYEYNLISVMNFIAHFNNSKS